MTSYAYDERTKDEIEHMVRLALPGRVILRAPTLAQDFGGIDAHYQVTSACALQIRVRNDRPAYAPDEDVTFRTSEPAMIVAGTYAPLMLFLWFWHGRARAGKLIDIYTLAEGIDLLRAARERRQANTDGTAWFPVRVSELYELGALLRQGDEREWAPVRLGGTQRTVARLSGGSSPDSSPSVTSTRSMP